MAGRTNRYRRGEKSTSVRVGYLGGKPSLIANWGGRMYGAPLSLDGAGNITRDSNFGNIRVGGDAVFDSGASVLRITGGGISIKESNIEVASFGSTVVIGEVGASKSNVQITSGAINLRNNTDNKITLDTSGNITMIGKIVIGDAFASNVTFGNDNSSSGVYNINLGYQAGKAMDSVNCVANVNIGSTAGKNLVTNAGYNISIGNASAATATTGDYNICIGASSNVSTANAQNQIAIGYQATAHAHHSCTIGNASLTAIEPGDDGGVNLGSASYSYDAVWAEDGDWNGSDRRIKEDIAPLSLGLEFINKLNPVSYKKKDKEEVYDGDRLIQRAITYNRKHAGFIAQDIKQVMDDMNISTNDFAGYADANVNEGIDKLFLRYTEFIAPLTKAVQELSTKLDNMDVRLTNLEAV